MSDRIYAQGDWGAITADGGLIYPLTACCRASATGSIGGAACRGCYESIPSIYGACVQYGEPDAIGILAAILEELTGTRGHRDTAATIVGKVGSAQRHPSRARRSE